VHESRRNHQEHTDNELEKVVVVINTYTVIDPWAVVIEPFHTALAYRAMP